jgi:hypothetical protein
MTLNELQKPNQGEPEVLAFDFCHYRRHAVRLTVLPVCPFMSSRLQLCQMNVGRRRWTSSNDHVVVTAGAFGYRYPRRSISQPVDYVLAHLRRQSS